MKTFRILRLLNKAMVEEIPFLRQNTVTIFVNPEDLSEHNLSENDLKIFFSKKVDGGGFAKKSTLGMTTLEDTVKVCSVVESLLAVGLTTTGMKLWETIQLKSPDILLVSLLVCLFVFFVFFFCIFNKF